MKWLVDNEFLRKGQSILDYGCGRGDDVRLLRGLGFNIVGYDPYWEPWAVDQFRPDVITCNFVLNTIEDSEKIDEILNKMFALKAIKCYTSVRADVKNLNGLTKRGTYQRYVDIRRFDPWAELLHKTSSYLLWRLS